MTDAPADGLRETSAVYRAGLYDSARFAILFRLAEAFFLVPLAALVARGLMGRDVIDSTELLNVALSPRGFIAGFLSLAVFVTIRLVEQAGLAAIAAGVLERRRVTSPAALRIVLQALPRLLGLVCLAQLAGLVVFAPLLSVAGYISARLLARNDINYYLAEWPAEFVKGVVVISLLAIPTVGILIWLTVRCQLGIQTLLFEKRNPWQALRESARLVQHAWRRSAWTMVRISLLVFGLGLIASGVDSLCGWGASLLVGESLSSQFAVFVGLLVLHTALTGIITLPGPCIAAAALTILYRDRRNAQPGEKTDPWPGTVAETVSPDERRMRRSRLVLAGLPLAMLCLEIGAAALALQELYDEREVVVTAHRGGTIRSIENTLDAIREAIDDGAQYAEIDVQMSQDGTLIVTHDSDFSRLAGVARKVWEMTSAEISEIELRIPSAPEIPRARVPTLDEVLELARKRIRLNIELKYYGDRQPQLAEKVVEAVRAKRMSDRVVIQSLHYAGLREVRQFAPEIPIGYLFSVNARQPKRLDVDFLSVLVSRVSAPMVRAAHRRGQEVHVWTVDKPADVQRMIDLGVDNLITSRPREALTLIDEQSRLQPVEKALRRLRAWFRR